MNSYPLCSSSMSKEECELYILQKAISKAEKKKGKLLIEQKRIQHLIELIQQFIIDNKLIIYGGIAINNILPQEEQFYKEHEFPDYDIFSFKPVEHAKKLVDILIKEGFQYVEAKSGLHYGTYKVFSDFIPVVDITHIPQKIYNNLFKNSINIGGFYYAPPNFLRMSMYLELSSPIGDVSRWNKVYNRLQLLNRFYPIMDEKVKRCPLPKHKQQYLFKKLREHVQKQGIVVIGTYAYSLLMSRRYGNPRIDGFHNNPKECLQTIKNSLKDEPNKKMNIVFHKQSGEIIPEHYELRMDNTTLMILFKPQACHSYNTYHYKKNSIIRVASIDTLLRMYLSFIIYPKPYYDENLLLCMCHHIITTNKRGDTGLWKRFSLRCYGKQKTLQDIRREKRDKYKTLKKGSKEWNKWFFYYPKRKTKKLTKTSKKIPSFEIV